MAYKLSDRLRELKPGYSERMKEAHDNSIELHKITLILLLFSIISLLTAFRFNWEKARLFDETIAATAVSSMASEEQDFVLVGPITVLQRNQVYSINVRSPLPLNSWTFVAGEVLDNEKEYLFSFGQELWHEEGYDEGRWEESDDSYHIKITFPEPGEYYLNFSVQGSYIPQSMRVWISTYAGSSIPHFMFGVLCLLAAIGVSCYGKQRGSKLIEKMCATLLFMDVILIMLVSISQ